MICTQDKLYYEYKFLNRSRNICSALVDFATSHLSRNEIPNGAHFAHNNYVDLVYMIYLALAISTTSYQFINIRESAWRLLLLQFRIHLVNDQSCDEKSQSPLLVVDSGLMSLPVRKV